MRFNSIFPFIGLLAFCSGRPVWDESIKRAVGDTFQVQGSSTTYTITVQSQSGTNGLYNDSDNGMLWLEWIENLESMYGEGATEVSALIQTSTGDDLSAQFVSSSGKTIDDVPENDWNAISNELSAATSDERLPENIQYLLHRDSDNMDIGVMLVMFVDTTS